MEFLKNLTLSNAQIKEARAKVICEDAKDAQEEIVRVIKREKRELDSKLLSLTDMYPDSELSLRVVKTDFNAKTLFSEIQKCKIEREMKAVELRLAEETYQEWFGNVEEA